MLCIIFFNCYCDNEYNRLKRAINHSRHASFLLSKNIIFIIYQAWLVKILSTSFFFQMCLSANNHSSQTFSSKYAQRTLRLFQSYFDRPVPKLEKQESKRNKTVNFASY